MNKLGLIEKIKKAKTTQYLSELTKETGTILEKKSPELIAGEYDAVIAIDYDDLDDNIETLTDLIKARNHLNENGFLALGYSNEDTISGKNIPNTVLTSKKTFIISLTQDLLNLTQRDEIKIAVPELNLENFPLFLYVLALSAEKTNLIYKKITISVLETKKYDNKTEIEINNLLKELFPSTEIKISTHEKNPNKYNIIYTGVMEESFKDKTFSNLLEKQTFTYILQKKGHLHRKTGSNSR